MKKLICAILICLMLPVACISLTGCGKDEHNIKDFYTTYKNIANNTNNLSLVAANDVYQVNNNSYKIDINYSQSSILSELVEDENSQYYHLKYFYHQLLDDSLAPLYFFGGYISNSKNVSKKQTNKLFDDLYALEEDYKDINYYLGSLINSLNLNEDTNISLSYLKRVFNEYEQAITNANKLSTMVCDVYFNVVLSTPNYNYSIKTAEQMTETDLTRISNDVKKRMYYYKSVYANIYNQLYVRGNNLAELLTSSTNITPPSYTPYNNMKSIPSITNKPMSSLIVNKSSIHTNAVALYNIQNSFSSAYNDFVLATDKVVYAKLDASSSVDERNYASVITQFSNGIAIDSYEVIIKLINLLYS